MANQAHHGQRMERASLLHPVTCETLLFVSDNFVHETRKRRALPGTFPKDPDFRGLLPLRSRSHFTYKMRALSKC